MAVGLPIIDDADVMRMGSVMSQAQRMLKITDDRGRAATLCPPSAVPAANEELRALLRSMEYLSPVGSIVTSCGFAGGAFALALFTRQRPAAVIASGVVLAVLVPIFILRKIAVGRQRVGMAARRCLAHGLCASCGYSIVALPSEDDGVRVCPECGAAWRLAS